MANIANPLTGTKIDGSTFNAAECNSVGASLIRCLVNDGQGDLIANASINGGTNKSFALAGMTTVGITCSGALTETCGTFALTTGGVSIDSTGGVSIEASGSVDVDVSGGDIILSTDQDIILNKLSVPAFFTAFTGTAWPSLGARTIVDAMPAFAMALTGFSVNGTNYAFLTQDVEVGVAVFWLNLPPGTILNSVTLRLRSKGQPASGVPSGGDRAKARLRAVDTFTGAITELMAAEVHDASINAAAYAAWHPVVLAPTTPYTVPAGVKVCVRLFGAEDGGDPDVQVQVLPPTCSLTIASMRPI